MIHSYRLHDYLNIEIHQDQLPLNVNYEHYFGMLKTEEPSPAPNYVIKEYKDFRLPEIHFRNGDLNLGFANGVCFPAEKYAISYSGDTITEYTNCANRATNLLLQLLLLSQNKSLVHSAGIRLAGKGIIFPALGGAGKSLLVGELRHRDDFVLFGDDFVIVDDNSNMHSYLSAVSVYDYHLDIFPELLDSEFHNYLSRRKKKDEFFRKMPGGPILRQISGRISSRLRQNDTFPGAGWDLDYVKVPVSKLFSPAACGSVAKIDASVYLSRYTGSEFRVETLSLKDLCRRIEAVLAIEFRYASYYLHFLAAFGGVDMVELNQTQERIIRASFSECDIYHVLIPHTMPPREYVNKMSQFLDSIVR